MKIRTPALDQLFSGNEAVHGTITRQCKRLPRLEAVAKLARLVWEDDDLAREFLCNAQPQLGGRSPLALAVAGANLLPVLTLLNSLEYSLPV